jgi:hypothetical protein
MTRYSIVEEPRREGYRSLVRFLRGKCDNAILVVRDLGTMGAAARDILKRLSPVLVDRADSDHWPGTKLVGHAARVHRYTLNEACIEVIRSTVEGLYEWVSPERPEDLCLLRGEVACLTTITHERTAYLDLTPAECEELRAASPHLRLHRGELVPPYAEPYRLFGAFLDADSVSGPTSIEASLETYVSMSTPDKIAEVQEAIRTALFSLRDEALLRVVLERWGAAPLLYSREKPSSLLRRIADQLQRNHP